VHCCAGVTRHGSISALPVEVVRVWLGKYEAGTAVLAEYATQVVEFNLTEIFKGAATIDDTLSEWSGLSNAKTVDSYAVQLAAKKSPKGVIPFWRSRDEHNHTLVTTRPPAVAVAAVFRFALRAGAVTYLSNNLIHKLRPDLSPKLIRITPISLEVEFHPPANTLVALGTDPFEDALNAALSAAEKDPKSDMAGESWTLKDTSVTFAYGS
jgi:hypothetical protein